MKRISVLCVVVLGSLLAACAHNSANPADPKLLEHRWNLVELQGEALTDAQKAKKPYLQLQGEFASAYAGCNRLSAPYKAKGENISFGSIRQTKMACMNNMKFEQGFIDMLAYSQSWSLDDGILRFYGPHSDIVAAFRADPK